LVIFTNYLKSINCILKWAAKIVLKSRTENFFWFSVFLPGNARYSAIFASKMDSWFSAELIKWYKVNKRDLPWRHQKDPYLIWLSEIILQQTQVKQGLAYYARFTKKFPNVKKLALASDDEVLKLWQGLGYYSRARNLHATAKIIHYEHNGVFPNTFDQIKALKGIGDYTASAIASFAYDQPYAVVDGNVYRVLSRVFGIQTPIDSNTGKKEFQKLANDLLNKKTPALHNQAIMEFGSQFCKPVNPNCENCVMMDKCFAFKTKKVSDLPIKEKKIKVRDRFFNYVIAVDQNDHILINKRKENDIWAGLYEFCLIESPKEFSSTDLHAIKEFKTIVGKKFTLLHASNSYKHVLTHQHLYTKFYVIRVSGSFGSSCKTCTLKTLKSFAFPRLIDKFLNHCDLKEMF
jgi:A/G-specific adenine glycosylase